MAWSDWTLSSDSACAEGSATPASSVELNQGEQLLLAVAELGLADSNLVIANLDLGHAERSPQHHKIGEDLIESAELLARERSDVLAWSTLSAPRVRRLRHE